jgi:hypothetical protein
MLSSNYPSFGHPRSFAPQALGGVHASYIEAQDSVAAFLALEAISGQADASLTDIDGQHARIVCEWQDDLELLWDEGRIHVQVKNQQMSLREVHEAVTRLYGSPEDHEDHGACRLRLFALGGLEKPARHLPEHLDQLRSAIEIRSEKEGKKILEDFERKWKLPASRALLLHVDTRDLRRDSPTARDLFSGLLRRALPVSDFTDGRVDQLFRELAGETFAPCRRQRGWVSLADARDRMLAQLLPLDIATYEIEYTRTEFGYIKDPLLVQHLAREKAIVGRAWRRILFRWIRHVWRDALLNILYRGAVKCPACNHPLLANFVGLRGIACPDCGYQPYLTLVYICYCSELIVLVEQPEVDKLQLYASALEKLRSSDLSCTECGSHPQFEKLPTRIAMIPFPVPVERYSPKSIIAMREQLGWERGVWRKNETPMEAMLRTRRKR